MLVDREQTLAACANNLYNLTITVRGQLFFNFWKSVYSDTLSIGFQATYGAVGLKPPVGSAHETLLAGAALTKWIGGGTNETVLKLGGTLSTLNVASKYLRFLPAKDHHGLEAKIVLTLSDDGKRHLP